MIQDQNLKGEIDNIIRVYEEDNCSAWDLKPDGQYVIRSPLGDDCSRNAQDIFIQQASSQKKNNEENMDVEGTFS